MELEGAVAQLGCGCPDVSASYKHGLASQNLILSVVPQGGLEITGWVTSSLKGVSGSVSILTKVAHTDWGMGKLPMCL